MAEQTTGRTEYGVAPEAFVTAWQQSATAAEAAERLSMPRAIACARASVYRRAGVRLKMMPRVRKGRKPIDVETLNRLVEGLAAGNSVL